MSETELRRKILLNFRENQATHINARDILLGHIGDREVRCAIVTACYNHVTISLKKDYTQGECAAFFDALSDVHPDQYGWWWGIAGTVWYTDGTWSVWSSGDEYEQYWQHCSAPQIPDSLL